MLPGLNRESAEGQYVPLITAQEQVKSLISLTIRIDVISTEYRKIELLKEYRQSLISKVVTEDNIRNEV